MNRNLQFVVVLILIVLLTAGTMPAAAGTPETRTVGLVQVRWKTPADLAPLDEMGIPVYARLFDAQGPYLLVGARAGEVAALAERGLDVKTLDADVAGASYYLASPAPNRRAPDWGRYGQVLLADGQQALLRVSPATESGTVQALSQAAVSVQRVTFDPKPLYLPASTQAFPQVIVPDPLVESMVAQVTSTQVSQYNRELAGDLPVWVDGDWYTIATRYTDSGTPIQKAGHYVGQHMEDLGLDVDYHIWDNATNPNVIAEMPGLVDPDDIYIIGGHLDSITYDQPMILAPGADDNASAVVAGMLAADIFSQYQWGCTLRFAFWTGEEQGLLGSHAYAQRAYNAGENILGYLNLDMIAWNTIGSAPDIDLIYNPSMPATLQLAQLFDDVVDAYGFDLVPELRTSLSGGSDHSSFWQYGYTSILGIEDQSDFNPYYHSNGDTPAHTDLAYFTEYVKASLATFAHETGCLIAEGIGALDGHVTDAGSGAPLPGVTITMLGQGGAVLETTTDSSGYYTQTLLADTYTVTAEAYGYLPAVVGGVVVVTDTVTTVDMALQPAPAYVVSGTVTEAGSGVPLLAEITLDGSPETATTDPTGYYELTLPVGNYTMHVQAERHRSQERAIVVAGDQVQSFVLEPLPCILLVDDDNNAPDVRPYYETALDALGYEYDVFVGGGGTGPSQAEMEGYNTVIWFSGDAYSSSSPAAGPDGDDEAALAVYLDGGGTLFLSAQDYLYDMGLTSFGQTYLGIGSYTNDDGNASTKYGVPGDPVGGGLGPYPLAYPSGLSDYGDVVNAGAGASVAFRAAASGGNNLDVDKAGANWKTVFFGTSWVPIQNASAANGQAVLQRIIDWFGGCTCEAPENVGFSWTPPEPAVGETVTFSGTAESDLAVGYEWDLGDGSEGQGPVVDHAYTAAGDYTVWLTATNFCGAMAISHTVPVTGSLCEPVAVVTVTVTPGECGAVLAAEVTGTPPISYTWDLGELGVWEAPVVTATVSAGGTYPYTLTVVNCASEPAVVTGTFTVECPVPRWHVYLPLVWR